MPLVSLGALVAMLIAQAPAPTPASAPRDTAESTPAPLLVPGRAVSDTAARSRATRAKEQYELGRAFERQGGGAPAIASYRNAIRLDPAIPDANYRAGMLFNTVAQFGEAVKHFAAEVEHHPERADAARELGIALARIGEPTRAIAQLELLTRRRPRDGESWRALGFAYGVAKRPADAERALRQALVLPPATAAEHRDLGALLATRGRAIEARAEYRRAIEIEPREPTVWINLANLEQKQGHPEAALAAYREAESRDSTLVPALQGQVQTLHALSREAEAGAVYRRLLRARPADLEARLDAMRLFEQLGRNDVALEIARDGVRHDRRSADAHALVGMALQAGGRHRDALQAMRAAETLARDPAGRERVTHLIAGLRAVAPDSLRAVFDADSVAHLVTWPKRQYSDPR